MLHPTSSARASVRNASARSTAPYALPPMPQAPKPTSETCSPVAPKCRSGILPDVVTISGLPPGNPARGSYAVRRRPSHVSPVATTARPTPPATKLRLVSFMRPLATEPAFDELPPGSHGASAHRLEAARERGRPYRSAVLDRYFDQGYATAGGGLTDPLRRPGPTCHIP